MSADTNQEAIVTSPEKTSKRKRPRSQSEDETLVTDTIYVSNIHPRIAEVHLQKLFGRFGEIQRVNIVRKQAPIHSIAFIKFSSPKSAKAAIEKVHGQKLLEMTLHVKPAHDRKDEAGAQRSMNTDSDRKKKATEMQKKIDSIRKTLDMKDCKPS